jgi:hypothetical protein
MKSSFHSLIPFLPLFCNSQFWRPNSIQFLSSQSHVLAGWYLETRPILLNWNLLITFLHGPRRKHSLSIAVKACLQRRYIAAEVTQLLLVYSLPRECAYRVVCVAVKYILTSLFRLSGVMSHYYYVLLLLLLYLIISGIHWVYRLRYWSDETESSFRYLKVIRWHVLCLIDLRDEKRQSFTMLS